MPKADGFANQVKKTIFKEQKIHIESRLMKPVRIEIPGPEGKRSLNKMCLIWIIGIGIAMPDSP